MQYTYIILVIICILFLLLFVSPVLSHPPPSFPSPFNHHLSSTSHPSIASSATIHSSDEWITNTSPVWSTGGVSLPKPSSTPLLNPSPSSIGMQPPHIRQQKHGYGGTGGAGTGNTWVTEMEQVRINELNQMKHQQQFREDRATASMKMQHQHLSQQKV